MKHAKLFVISAPSGAGKTSLVAEVIRRLSSEFSIARVITYTSKEPRLQEIPGRDYHFLSHQEFEQKIQEGYFLEWSKGLGHYYGTPATILEDLKEGHSRILIIDREGAQEIQKLISGAILIWISVPSIEILHERLCKRGADSLEAIARRIERAKLEIAEEQQNSFYDFAILNDNFELALQKLEHVLRSELTLQKSPKARLDRDKSGVKKGIEI